MNIQNAQVFWIFLLNVFKDSATQNNVNAKKFSRSDISKKHL